MTPLRSSIVPVLLLAFTASAALPARGATLRPGPEIRFGGQGGWDDLSIDPETGRLFVSHSDRVIVIDTASNKVIKEIPDMPGVHGIALAPGLGKAFASNGKEGKVSVIDLATLAAKSRIAVGENPDAILYEPSSQQVFVFNGRSHSCSVIDAKSEKVVATVDLPGKPEFAAADPAEHRVYVNIEDKDSVVALDTKSHKIAAKWKLEGCESPSGIALDAAHHRLFSACENEKLVMVDVTNGHTVASVPTGKGTDGAAFDPELHLAFSPNGKSGTLTVIREETPDRLAVVENVRTRIGARTMTLNRKDHRLFLPTAEFQPSPDGKRPKAVDGTQTILTFAP